MQVTGSIGIAGSQLRTPATIEDKIKASRTSLSREQSPGLINFCEGYFGLISKPMNFPAAVKWQLYFAAQASKGANGMINVGGEFGVDHLNPQDFAILYRVLTAYHNSEEKTDKGVDGRVFHRHLEIMEARFQRVCKENIQQGLDLVGALRNLGDHHNLGAVIARMDAYIADLSNPHNIDRLLDTVRRAPQADESLMGLIQFADMSYDLINASKQDIPDEVRWQLYFAGRASRGEDGKFLLGEFAVEHLNQAHFALLFSIFADYAAYESSAKEEHDYRNTNYIPHREVIVQKVDQLLANRETGRTFIQALRSLNNPNLEGTIADMEIFYNRNYRPKAYQIIADSQTWQRAIEVAQKRFTPEWVDRISTDLNEDAARFQRNIEKVRQERAFIDPSNLQGLAQIERGLFELNEKTARVQSCRQAVQNFPSAAQRVLGFLRSNQHSEITEEDAEIIPIATDLLGVFLYNYEGFESPAKMIAREPQKWQEYLTQALARFETEKPYIPNRLRYLDEDIASSNRELQKILIELSAQDLTEYRVEGLRRERDFLHKRIKEITDEIRILNEFQATAERVLRILRGQEAGVITEKEAEAVHKIVMNFGLIGWEFGLDDDDVPAMPLDDDDVPAMPQA